MESMRQKEQFLMGIVLEGIEKVLFAVCNH